MGETTAQRPEAGLSGEEYSKLKGRLSDFIDHVESKRDSAKAAAKHYPSKSATLLGEADAYDDVASDLRYLLSSLPQ